MTTENDIKRIEADWATNERWKGVQRGYTAADVVRLRGTVKIEYSLARQGAEKLWGYLHTEPFVNSLGALTGNQAMQQVRAGLKAIYVSGWQVAGDANVAGQMYPDQSRCSALLMRRTTLGTESAGYSDWSGYICPARLASAATCQPDR